MGGFQYSRGLELGFLLKSRKMASFPEPRKWSNLGCGCINCGSIGSSVDFRKLALREAGDRIVKVYRLFCLSCFQQLSEETPQNINVSEIIPEISRKNENCYHRFN